MDTRANSLKSFHDYLFTRLEPFFNDPPATLPGARNHSSSLDRVVLIHDENRLSFHILLDGSLGNQKRVLAIFQDHAKSGELSGSKYPAGIRELKPERER